ncbi:MAG: excinuclease ABC subunit C [Candidatus Lloydbacteria bacterium RIFCSPHIGHO2_01_FULL_41_20]|uniref:Excinuclease ABC subunit C n=1 Tax=Candidatus Lloydbacteria bacterium RIFCSPHIGHO2_01_FULL_41_20 TaxID=1798657 RepID=A0A1G2CU99_9BACT|nr:MAG: excinuclease ABC subunit C [Candidatus Lloydbacteria bacterium RIFCSPHIGHO2_01_FULL_41_20]
MFYVYTLQSKKDNQLYIGCTNDLKKRLLKHNTGQSVSTAHRIPLSLIYYEAYINKEDAFAREQYLKTGWGRVYIRKTLRRFLSLKT